MTRNELKICSSLASVLFLRMFGLFLILPVFSLYAKNLPGATAMLVGIAFGIYGLTQVLLQIPFGVLSDRLGRKPIIAIGLLIFAVGSLIACVADSIWMMILGRAMQGGGAISAALMALVADLTQVEQRTKAMALIGMSVGAAFILAFIIAPVIVSIVGVSGIFLLSAVLAILAIMVLYLLVPDPQCPAVGNALISWTALGKALRDQRLMRLNLGIFILHAILMANFVVVPILLQDHAGLAVELHWQIYLPVLLASAIIVLPAIIMGRHTHSQINHFRVAIVVLLLSQLSYALWHNTLTALSLGLLIFFVAFNYLESTLPSLVSSIAEQDSKGAALGIYASCQFAGIFTGGLIGGMIYQYLGLSTVFIFGVVIILPWLIITLSTNKV